MSFATFATVRLFPHTNVEHVQEWIAENIDDCEENSGYHIIKGTDKFGEEDTYILFASREDMYQFEEDYENA